MVNKFIEPIFTSIWYRFLETVIVLGIMYYIVSLIVIDPYTTACIMIPTTVLMIYVEIVFKSPWPRILLPYSLANSTLLASIMMYGTVPYEVYQWIIVGYALAIFALFHALTRMFSLFLRERSSRFRVIVEGVLIDLGVFVIISTIMTGVLMNYHAIMLPYGLMLILFELAILIIIPWFIEHFIVPSLLEKMITIYGYAHPREPEIEELYFELSSVTVLFILVVPAVMAYTSTTLIRRAFIPMALLGVYETIIMAYYTITYLVSIHGAFVETLFGDKIIYIEYGRVIKKWRDVAWFINLSLQQYLKMKYLSALFMFFQGLEILSLRTSDRELYFGNVYDLLEHGYSVLEKNKRLKRYVLRRPVEEAIEELKPDKVYVIEANWKPLEKTGYEEELKKAMGSIVNIYCKFYEFRKVDQEEVRQCIKNTIGKLEQLRNRVRGRALEVVINYRNKLEELLKKSEIKPSDLEEYLLKQPLTINMLRNYIVHGQLYKNALVYRNSRVKADRLFNRPAILYALYTLLLTAIIDKHPELLE